MILFLEPFQNGSYQVSGFTQGKFNVQRDPDTGQAFLVRPASEGVQLVGAPDGDARTRRAPKSKPSIRSSMTPLAVTRHR